MCQYEHQDLPSAGLISPVQSKMCQDMLKIMSCHTQKGKQATTCRHTWHLPVCTGSAQDSHMMAVAEHDVLNLTFIAEQRKPSEALDSFDLPTEVHMQMQERADDASLLCLLCSHGVRIH